MEEGIRPGLRGRELRPRAFGLGLAAVLGLFALLAWRRGAPRAPWLAGAGVLLAAAALARPAWVAALQRAWMAVGGRILEALTLAALAVLYYGVFTPYGLALRRLGRDPMGRRFEAVASYWERRAPATDFTGYEKQF